MEDPRALDLRRNAGRELAELLARRAEVLEPQDRELIRLHFGEGLTAVALARVRGEAPRRLRAKLRRLASRLVSPRFEAVLRRRADWPRRRRMVASAVILRGHSFRDTAEELGLTLHQVRREMSVVEALVSEELSRTTPHPHGSATPASGARSSWPSANEAAA